MLAFRNASKLAAILMVAITMLCATLGASRAQAPAPKPPGQQQPENSQIDPKALGVMVYIFLHELGHGLIGELQLPAVGPEEDAADEFAAVVLVYNFRQDPRFKELALWAARIWRVFGQNQEKAGSVHPWTDEHAPNMIRYGKILCILAGAEPEAFKEEVERSVAADQQERFKARCKWEFQKKWRAWDTLLKAHRRNIDPKLPGDKPADAPGAKMDVDYSWLDAPFANEFTKKWGPMIKASKIFDSLAEGITKYYVMPRPTTIFVRECDQFNAWYTPQSGSISMCINLAEDVLRVFASAPPDNPNPGRPGPRPRQ